MNQLEDPRPAICPRRPSPADRGTYYAPTRGNRRLVVNPNECGVCGRPRHPDGPHHKFQAAAETRAMAQWLGWPMPEEVTPWASR